MLSTILRVTLPGNAKAIMNWERVNSNAYTRISLTKDRFLQAPVFYSGMHQVFRYLLTNIEFSFLEMVARNPMSTYLSDLVPLANIFKKSFDTVSISTENYGMLMDRQNHPVIPEIWVSTSRKNPLTVLPLESIDWNNWKTIRVSRVINYDVPFLNIDFLKGTLTFPRDITPSYGLVAVDIPCIWLKFMSWWKSEGSVATKKSTPDETDYDNFIHRIILPDFYQDFTRIFILNTTKLAIQGEFDDWKDAVQCLQKDYRIALSGFDAGAVDLFTCLGLVKTRDMSVEDFLSTPWLMNPDKTTYSLRSLMKNYVNQWRIPDLRQYYWITLLRDLDLTLITTTLLKLSPKYPIGERTKKELRYVIEIYERAIPWSHVHNASLRATLQNSFVRLKNTLSV